MEKRRTEIKILGEKQTMKESVKSQIIDSKVSTHVFTSVVTAHDKNFMYI